MNKVWWMYTQHTHTLTHLCQGGRLPISWKQTQFLLCKTWSDWRLHVQVLLTSDLLPLLHNVPICSSLHSMVETVADNPVYCSIFGDTECTHTHIPSQTGYLFLSSRLEMIRRCRSDPRANYCEGVYTLLDNKYNLLWYSFWYSSFPWCLTWFMTRWNPWRWLAVARPLFRSAGWEIRAAKYHRRLQRLQRIQLRFLVNLLLFFFSPLSWCVPTWNSPCDVILLIM